jgi:hypothetical protein
MVLHSAVDEFEFWKEDLINIWDEDLSEFSLNINL